MKIISALLTCSLIINYSKIIHNIAKDVYKDGNKRLLIHSTMAFFLAPLVTIVIIWGSNDRR